MDLMGKRQPRADIAADGFGDCRFGGATIAIDTPVRPFDAAIARRDVRLGEHDEAALEAARAGQFVELVAGGGIKGLAEPDGDVRRRDGAVGR